MTKKGGERSRIQSERATKDSALGGGEVVVDQFTREFAALLQLTREKHAKQLTTESFGGIRDDATNSRQEVAFFGDITQKLVPLVDKLMQATPDQISTAKKVELLLVFGDKFYHVQEFQAASVHHGVLGRILSATASTTPKRSRLEGQAYVRSLFGAAMSCFHIQKRSDRFVKHPGRLEKMMEALTFLRLGMETTVAMERQYSGQFSWLTLNGSVLLYSIAKPLQALGFSREVVAYLKWSLLAMESAVALSTTKYLMWRLQLGSAICDCYDDLALKEAVKAHQHTKSAVACAAYLQQAVQRLRKEEELDMPLPGDVQRTLAQAETSSAMLVARANASAAHQPLTRNMIAAAFPAAVQNCVLHGDGAIPRTNPELMTSVALQIWREFVLPMLKELDATEPSQFSKPLIYCFTVNSHFSSVAGPDAGFGSTASLSKVSFTCSISNRSDPNAQNDVAMGNINERDHLIDHEEEKLCRQLMAIPEQDLESEVPAPPIVISRSSSAITVKVVEYHPSIPSLRKKRVLYYMIFAKPAGAGTAVSTNSNLLAGTASPVYPPRLHVTISGLLPNESYVFAVAAFDSKHELIHSIGETSEPVVALNPLPLAMCYGYLAKACYDVQLATRANKAATYLYNAVVSHDCDGRPSWMANPFYRQALKRDAVARFPVPILNLCIQALLILCHNEPGDLERDGKLVTSSDLDAHSLAGTQTKALEDSRKIAMAIEIACATDNQEAIHVLCFKGYRFLLPLLHLKGSCDGITFAALVTFYQALHVIPSEKWDVETRSICARKDTTKEQIKLNPTVL
uniref:Fibronectin type-III domain-containing protein n=1 Tax=Phytophthora ramorum TaxID=164328 RepID=H3HB76_PHYRM